MFVKYELYRCNLHYVALVAGANVNSSTPNGRTPLHLAASQGHGQIIDSLLQNGKLLG